MVNKMARISERAEKPNIPANIYAYFCSASLSDEFAQ
jgi:hypothetical protein